MSCTHSSGQVLLARSVYIDQWVSIITVTLIAMLGISNRAYVDRDFREALEVTSQAKANFLESEEDLYKRGKTLIMNSVAAGVTTMRAHVEVDMTVQRACLIVGLRLQEDLKHLCDVQLSGKFSIKASLGNLIN